MVNRRAGKIDGIQVANAAILRGRYVALQFTQGDYVVMAVCAGGLRAIETQIMVECTAQKRARVVAVGAIPIVGRGWYTRVSDGGRHMGVNQLVAGRRPEFVGRLTARCCPMTEIASVADNRRNAVVGHRNGKTRGAVTKRTILGCCRVCRYRRPLAGRVDAVAIVVAGFAGYHRGVDQAVIEHAVEAETRNAVAVTAIDGRHIDSCHQRMARRWITDIVAGRYTMTGIAAGPDNSGVAVIGEGSLKTDRGVTAVALGTGNRMGARRSVDGAGCFTDGCVTIVASGTATGNARMIKAAIGIQFEKTGGIVATVTLGIRR